MAKDILEEIVAWKRIEVAQQKELVPPTMLYNNVEELISKGDYTQISMRDSLAKSDSGIIAEFKRKSPSKGWIKEEGDPKIIPASYDKNGASAISILTDEKYFGGKMSFIKMMM